MNYTARIQNLREEVSTLTGAQHGAFIIEIVRSSPLTYRRADTGDIMTPADLGNLRSRFPESVFIMDDIA